MARNILALLAFLTLTGGPGLLHAEILRLSADPALPLTATVFIQGTPYNSQAAVFSGGIDVDLELIEDPVLGLVVSSFEILSAAPAIGDLTLGDIAFPGTFVTMTGLVGEFSPLFEPATIDIQPVGVATTELDLRAWAIQFGAGVVTGFSTFPPHIFWFSDEPPFCFLEFFCSPGIPAWATLVSEDAGYGTAEITLSIPIDTPLRSVFGPESVELVGTLVLTGTFAFSDACQDGADNDGDGLTDFPDDPGCLDAGDASENEAGLLCDDGIDNEGDGDTDFPGDPGCLSPTAATEATHCDDDLDNDGDGGTDWDGGAGLSADGDCVAAFKTTEDPRSPFSCGYGAELALLMPALVWLRSRRSRTRPAGGVPGCPAKA